MTYVQRTLAAGLLGASLTVAFAQGQVFGDPSRSRAAPNRTYHVRNYRLKLQFDQEKAEVLGDEVITLEPLAAGFRRFYLDSVDLTIESVSLVDGAGHTVSLSFEQREERLWIGLDRAYGAAERLDVRIVYHGFPRFGLFFENPGTNYPDRPREIWSQGETEFNHHWFPCWDYPNDMATSETITTVPEDQVVVSNGRLQGVKRARGSVTYDWVESVPHSSYLISVAIGPWQQVHDSYRGKPIDYYASRNVSEATVRRGFQLTPDMLGFFSRLLIDYPYEKYAQVAVHDFDFGGQENVSATTVRESLVLLQDSQALSDYPPTEVIAHELGQHWFGDYVQALDWADIWLNEGFATYLPALYTQYHEGNDAYRLQMKEYQETALAEDRQQYTRPIVDHHYSDDGMQMFDETTHEKGAVVLDMLRYVLDGSDGAFHPDPDKGLFFPALRAYLTRYAAHSVETKDLINSIDRTTGQDLGWFFDEWVYKAGSPVYRVAAVYDAAARSATVTVAQIQEGPEVPSVFVMPVDLAFHGKNGESLTIRVRNDQAEQRFRIPLSFEPLWIAFDPNNFIEKTLDFPQALPALTAAAIRDPCMSARLWAVGELGKTHAADSGQAIQVLSRVLREDPVFGVRIAAAGSLGNLKGSGAEQALIAGLDQSDSRVRAAAARALGELPSDEKTYEMLARRLEKDPSYAVRAAAASSLGRSGVPAAVALLQRARATRPEIHVATALDRALAATGAAQAVSALLADAKPGAPVQLRLAALSAMPELRRVIDRTQLEELFELTSEAIDDSYLPLSLAAEQLAVDLRLAPLAARLSDLADSAPTLWQREIARRLLERFQSGPPPADPAGAAP
ncbi:MAG TPA: M1 family aminopeptidase [Steroidobacteraceae bacterium]|jgi:aminopeptidase N|nr:M1 family aminopeptidase [Steroidobacteraceae bacterium]